jgi:hypothetical protein
VTGSGSVDSHYYDWVDRFDTLGLGHNTPIVTGNSSDSLIALLNGKFVIMRVPYPMGFFAKGMDGRIDDSNAGWKGKECGPHGAHALHSTAKREGARCPRSYTFKSAPIRSRTSFAVPFRASICLEFAPIPHFGVLCFPQDWTVFSSRSVSHPS